MSSKNLFPFKDSISGDVAITFSMPVRQIQITNMASNTTLSWRFRESRDWSVLEPTEIITMDDVNTHTLFLSAVDGAYRVLGQG